MTASKPSVAKYNLGRIDGTYTLTVNDPFIALLVPQLKKVTDKDDDVRDTLASVNDGKAQGTFASGGGQIVRIGDTTVAVFGTKVAEDFDLALADWREHFVGETNPAIYSLSETLERHVAGQKRYAA